MSNIGFRVFLKVKRPDIDLVKSFSNYPAAVVGDAMGRFGIMDTTIKSMNKPGVRMVGTALTVRTTPTDNLLVHKALELAKPGDVIVVSTGGGSKSHSIMGANIVAKAEKLGVAGFVLDAPVRDVYDIWNSEVAVYATGSTPAGPFKNGPGEINASITCGGVLIKPGDIIIGDDDGVVAVDKNNAEIILEKVKKCAQREAEVKRAIDAGDLIRKEIHQALVNKGCEFIDDYWD
ncbi:MAG: RraA family protein [Mahellales bacterium]